MAIDPTKITISEEIGRGTTGIVYRGRDSALGRDVAIKFFFDNTTLTISEVGKRMRGLSTVAHSNLISVFDITTDLSCPDESVTVADPSVVMEYFPGDELRDYLQQPSLQLSDAITISRQLLDGIGALHDAGLSHGDVSDRNILVSNTTAKILDPITHDATIVLSTDSINNRQRRDVQALAWWIAQILSKSSGITSGLGPFALLAQSARTIDQLRGFVNALESGAMPSAHSSPEASNALEALAPLAYEEITSEIDRWLAEPYPGEMPWEKYFDLLVDRILGLEHVQQLIPIAASQGDDGARILAQILRRCFRRITNRNGNPRWLISPYAVGLGLFYEFASALILSGHASSLSVLLTIRVHDPGSNERRPILESKRIVGWPSAFDGHCLLNWSFLTRLAEKLDARRGGGEMFNSRSLFGAINAIMALRSVADGFPSPLDRDDDWNSNVSADLASQVLQQLNVAPMFLMPFSNSTELVDLYYDEVIEILEFIDSASDVVWARSLSDPRLHKDRIWTAVMTAAAMVVLRDNRPFFDVPRVFTSRAI